MSDPKFGLLGNLWLDSDDTDQIGLVYQPDSPVKKAVGTITINVSKIVNSGIGELQYYYAGNWNSDEIGYELNAVVNHNGVMYRSKSNGNKALLSDTLKWQKYIPQRIKIYISNASYTGIFNRPNQDKFMKVFDSLVYPWDGTVMIPGIVVSPDNKLTAERVTTDDSANGVNDRESCQIGFNGIEEYL